MTLISTLHARSLLLAAAAVAGLAFGASLTTATEVHARSLAETQREAKQARKSVNQHKIIKPLEPVAEDDQDDRAPPRIRDFRKRIDRVPARPGAGVHRPAKAEPRIRDFRPGAQADRVPARPGRGRR